MMSTKRLCACVWRSALQLRRSVTTSAVGASLGLTVAGTAGCGAGGSSAPRVERTDSAGIEIVQNGGADVALEWSVERRLSLGGEADGPESFYRLDPAAIGVDSAGRLYVLDESNHRVVVFDSAGRHLRSVGRQGGGPGEFENAGGILVGPDGSVAVYDYAKAGFVRYAPDRTPLPDRPKEGPPPWDMAMTAAGPAVSRRRVDSERLMVLDATESVEIVVVEWTPPARESVSFPDCPIRINFPPLYVPDLVWAARGRTLVVSAGRTYELDLYRTDGQHLASFRRDAAPIPATIERAAQEEAAQSGRDSWQISAGPTRCSVPWEQYVEARGIEEWIPVIRRLAIAPDATIWVERRLAEGGARIDLITADGEYFGTLPAGTPFPAAFTPDGDLIVIEADALDVERLVIYDVMRSGTA